MAWPNFIAPPLSSPSTLNSCSAVRACTSAATSSAGLPPTRLPMPRAVRPAKPSGRVASFAVRRDGLAGEFAHRAIVPCRVTRGSRTADAPASAAAPPAATGRRAPPATPRAARAGRPARCARPWRRAPPPTAVSVVSGVTAGARRDGPRGCQLGQQRRPRGVAVAAVQVQAAQARPAAGNDQRPDEDAVALHDDRQLGHRPPQPRRAGLGGERAGRRSGPRAWGTRAPGRGACRDGPGLRGAPGARVAPARTPPARSSEVTACGRRALAADDDVLLAPGREQRVTVTGQPVGRRQGVRVRAQGSPPGLAEVSQEGAVGRQVEQQVPSRSACSSPATRPRRDAGPRGQGVQGRQVQAAVQPRRPAPSRRRSGPRGRRRRRWPSPPATRRAPAQAVGACGLSRGRAPCGSRLGPRVLGRRLWHAAASDGRRRPQATGPPGQARGGTRAVRRGPALSAVRLDQALPRMRFRLVPHTGHTPLAMRRPFVSTTCPRPRASPCTSRSRTRPCRSRQPSDSPRRLG